MERERVWYRFEEKGNTLEVVNLLRARRFDEVTFHFHLKEGTGPHTLSVREKKRESPCSSLLIHCDPCEVTLSSSRRRDKIKATVADVNKDGDYLYEIVEKIDGEWKTVLDPILEIEGGDLVPPMPTPTSKLFVAAGVGLLAGILTYKALK